MSAPSWAAVREEFIETHSLPKSERVARLATLDPAVRAEVESLLSALDERPDFLAPPQLAPSTIGPYRLIEEIGRGGMGTVYRAERFDGEFHKTVALKLIGGQMFAPEATRRFIAERQILARMDHPNIVRLLDGGISEGYRYFVMEFVAGESVTAHCVDRNLSVNHRLKLFSVICDAIQYAHGQLVIHRDLKAQNIIVTEDGTPKVLDFGIAQICTPESSGYSLTGLRPLSYSCASPEQVRGEALSASTDIYSLGVLLYEILAGVNPQVPLGSSSHDAFRRIVEEEFPPLPRSNELNAIIQKAAAKNPAERYSAAAELGAEVMRVVRGEPVLALTSHRFYVFRKFARRHRASLAAASVLALLLAAAAVLFAWQARIETRRFESARRFANQVIFQLQPEQSEIAGPLRTRATLIQNALEYLESLSDESRNDAPLLREVVEAYLKLVRAQAGGTLSLGKRSAAAESIQRGERLLMAGLARYPADPDLLRVASNFFAVAADFDVTNLNLPSARDNIARSADYLQKLKSVAAGESSTRRLEAYVLAERGIVESRSDEDAALVFQKRSLQLYEQLLAESPSDQALLHGAMTVQIRIADTLISNADSASAFEYAEKARALSSTALAQNPSDRQLQLLLSAALVAMARANTQMSKFREALPFAERALQIREAVLRTDVAATALKERVADAARVVAFCLLAVGRSQEAAEKARMTLEILSETEAQKALSPIWMVLRSDAHVVLAKVAGRNGNTQEFCREGRKALTELEWVLNRQPKRKLARRSADSVRSMIAKCPAP